jgi:ppGpp synthetase/RelA/SpoT-type nucleotidyltranferase
MALAKLNYSRKLVNKAGKILVDSKLSDIEPELAYQIINSWRAAHNFPLNTFQKRLRRLAKEFDVNCIVAQRIKRISSIQLKLIRFPSMKLAQIQDIGGCRAILTSINQVDELVNAYLERESRGIKHKLYGVVDDYILQPKSSGYRGVHLVYSYHSDKNIDYDGLKIEIQIRTLMQHAWATAVETVGTFIKQSLKSSQGEEKWLRFFALMGSIMALKENKPTVPNTPDNYKDLQREIFALQKELDVFGHLTAFRTSLNIFDEQRSKKDAHYYLLELDVQSRRVLVKSYSSNELNKATSDYVALEKRILDTYSTTDAVLVSTDSLQKLKTAYPNYYLDTETFLSIVREVTTKGRLKKGNDRQTRLF